MGGSAVDLPEDGWDAAFDVGIKSHFLAAKHAVPVMEKAGGGSIVNISSVHGLLSARNNLASVPLHLCGFIHPFTQLTVHVGSGTRRSRPGCSG